MKILDASANNNNNLLCISIENDVIDLQNVNYPLYAKIKYNQPTDSDLLEKIANELIDYIHTNNFEGAILPKGSPELLWILGKLWSKSIVPFFITSSEFAGDEIKWGMMK